MYITEKRNINVKWVSIVNLCNYRLIFTLQICLLYIHQASSKPGRPLLYNFTSSLIYWIYYFHIRFTIYSNIWIFFCLKCYPPSMILCMAMWLSNPGLCNLVIEQWLYYTHSRWSRMFPKWVAVQISHSCPALDKFCCLLNLWLSFWVSRPTLWVISQICGDTWFRGDLV